MGKSTLHRYVTIERIPEQPTVTRLADLIRNNGGTLDEAAVLRAHAAAEAAWPDWLQQRNGHRSPLTPGSADPTGDSRAEEPPTAHDHQPGEPAAVEHTAGRSRRKLILMATVAMLIIGSAGVGVAALLGPFHADDAQVQPSPSTTKCHFLSCEGRDHNEQSCDDARILPGGRAEGTMVVEVLYSSACQAAWGKAKGAPDGALVTIINTNGSEQHARAKSGPSKAAPKPTPMLPAHAGTSLQACINSDQFCTDWVEVPTE
jgi:hypothetical protein